MDSGLRRLNSSLGHLFQARADRSKALMRSIFTSRQYLWLESFTMSPLIFKSVAYKHRHRQPLHIELGAAVGSACKHGAVEIHGNESTNGTKIAEARIQLGRRC